MKNNAATEFEIVFPGGISIQLSDVECGSRVKVNAMPGKYRVVIETQEPEVNMQEEDVFERIEASELSLDDEFLQYNPDCDSDFDTCFLYPKNLYENIKSLIEEGQKDFWIPKYAPSLDVHGKMCYKAGADPAVGKRQSWWIENAREFKPECGSRIGTRKEYEAFLGVLIKRMVASSEWTIEEAWGEVCQNLTKVFEYTKTGVGECCGVFDTKNTSKFLRVGEEKYAISGEGCTHETDDGISIYPLNDYIEEEIRVDEEVEYATGWVILEECPY